MPKSEVIFAWGVPSDHGSAIYEVVLRESGELQCPCPGWVFKRTGKDRTCKHCKRLAGSAATVLSDFVAGRPTVMPSVQARPMPGLVRIAEQKTKPVRVIVTLE